MSLGQGFSLVEAFEALGKPGAPPEGAAQALQAPVDHLLEANLLDGEPAKILVSDYADRLARQAAVPRDEPAWLPFDNFVQALGVGRVYPDKTMQTGLVFQEDLKAPKHRIEFAHAVMASAIAKLNPNRPDPAYA